MKKIKNILEYSEFEKPDDLGPEDQMLAQKAIEIAGKSYSPYSLFPVGAAVILDDGSVYCGNNQENLSFPAGTCAERTVLNYVHANFPDKIIKKIAITATKSTAEGPVTPCGICRQVISEMESVQNQPIQILLHKPGGETYIYESSASLLPLAFEEKTLKKK